MAAPTRPVEHWTLRALTAADAVCNRLYGWRYNPLYQSGTIVVALLVVLLVTGLWLILFYRVGAPYASVERITANLWYGNWVRGTHRYASDVAVVAIVVHALRMFAQGRSWGPRTMAWVTGIVLLALVFVCGLTGYVMVWDVFGEVLAREGARMLDTLPVLSEPISRAFTGERPIPSVFFFLNLFAHVGIPLALLLVLWLHISRLARPTLMPARPLAWTLVATLVALSIALPVSMAAEANPFRTPRTAPVDFFYAFWLPLSRAMPGSAALGTGGATFLALIMVPLITRRRGESAPAKSMVDEAICTGCRQCSIDCPYEAITMLPRTDGRADEVARVTPAVCVSCGICAGSCAPMGVGPPDRTGRDQLARVRALLEEPDRRAGEIVVVCCERGAARFGPTLRSDGAVLYPVDCAGSLHTSVIEFMIRRGTGGVLVLACPPRDCWNREGPRWLNERMYHDREAELQARVDRRRVQLAFANASEPGAARAALREFTQQVAALNVATPEQAVMIDAICDPVPAGDEK
jgi:coenzyme F420-reducing hydrogenase delta subunit/Pyruvate/2-oxoacid:ferredoxin oxidoreductase delta subunit